MPFAPLYELLPGVARAETRSITVVSGDGLPRGSYAFVEMFCNDEACDLLPSQRGERSHLGGRAAPPSVTSAAARKDAAVQERDGQEPLRAR